MAIQKKRKTRMYEPWGYRDENNYQSADIIKENDLDSFFAKVYYNKDDNKIHFSNRDGLEVGNLDVNEFIKSDKIIERAWYEDGKIYIKFTNGDLITIDVKEILDENEFKDGLQVIDGIVTVLKDPASERWLTVSIDGVKVSGIQAEIDRLDERIDDEITRATSEEQRIEGRLNGEITRATNEENRIDSKLNAEITRATRTEQNINSRVDTLNDELDAEESIREANDAALGLRITTETNDRISAVTAEKNRAEDAESVLGNKPLYYLNAMHKLMDTFKASSVLNDRIYRKYPISSDGNYPHDVMTVFSKLPMSELYKTPDDSLNPHKFYKD